MSLYTFGYGKLRGSAELAKLIEGQRIDIVLDVRAAPTGRNPLWRAAAVADTVKQAGIGGYEHVQALGNPDFRSNKPAHRLVDEGVGIPRVVELLDAGLNVALMCVCQDTPHCHRRLIVAKVREQRPYTQVVELEVGKDPVVS